jgi:hypothetical protein
MAELKDAAEQFAQDLRAQNIAGLMMVFTPEGMTKAMGMQAQMQAQGPRKPATSHAINVGETEGEDTSVDIVMSGEDGDVTIATKWRDVAGAWKVTDIALRT